VCFTDDDCEPAPRWAELLAARARDGAGVAAGRTITASDATPYDVAAQTIVERLQLDSLDPATGALGFAPTCNLACSPELLRELPFDASFPDASGEDRDWCARAGAAGAAPRYEPEAVVVHRPGLSASSFLRQQYRYGRGGVRFRAAARAAGRPGGVAPASFYRGLAVTAARRGPTVGALIGVAQVATAAGGIAERLAPR
jgi:GT2 family glycosyltransferase